MSMFGGQTWLEGAGYVSGTSTEINYAALVQVEGQDGAPLCSFLSNVTFLTCVHASSEASDLFLQKQKNSPFFVSLSILLRTFQILIPHSNILQPCPPDFTCRCTVSSLFHHPHMEHKCWITKPRSDHEDVHLAFPSIFVRVPLIISAVVHIFFTTVFTQRKTNSYDSTDNRGEVFCF